MSWKVFEFIVIYSQNEKICLPSLGLLGKGGLAKAFLQSGSSTEDEVGTGKPVS